MIDKNSVGGIQENRISALKGLDSKWIPRAGSQLLIPCRSSATFQPGPVEHLRLKSTFSPLTVYQGAWGCTHNPIQTHCWIKWEENPPMLYIVAKAHMADTTRTHHLLSSTVIKAVEHSEYKAGWHLLHLRFIKGELLPRMVVKDFCCSSREPDSHFSIN